MTRCPGQDQRYWTPDDIFDVACPYCDYEIEFWKDEPFRLCRSCQKEVRNPRIDLGCAKWCKFSDRCLGRSVDEHLAAAPVITKLKTLLKKQAGERPEQYAAAMEIHRIASLLQTSEGGDPCRIKIASLLVGVVQNESAPITAARAFLKETILTEEENLAICEILRIVLSKEAPTSLDAGVVKDALVLAETALEDEKEIEALTTEGARMIFALRRSKKEKTNE